MCSVAHDVAAVDDAGAGQAEGGADARGRDAVMVVGSAHLSGDA